MKTEFSDLPSALLIALVALAVVQMTLMVVAIVIIMRTDPARLTLPRPAWIAIALLLNMIGPLLFLVAGRRRIQTITTPGASHETASAAIDDLYR